MKKIFLVGYMGVGKTTIGRQLGRSLNLQFIDLDKFIENRFHKSIRDIFAANGEKKFRAIEHEMLKELATFHDVLVATGGGTPCFYNNMDIMNQEGITVYIKSSVDQLISRLLASKNVRPLIQNKTPEELKLFVQKHLAEREPFYSKAQITYEAQQLVTHKDVNNSIVAIKNLIQNYVGY